MLGPASYITVENGSKMKQKLNISNTNPRGKIKKKMLGMNSTGYWLTLQVYRYWSSITCVGTKASTKKNKPGRRISIN